MRRLLGELKQVDERSRCRSHFGWSEKPKSGVAFLFVPDCPISFVQQFVLSSYPTISLDERTTCLDAFLLMTGCSQTDPLPRKTFLIGQNGTTIHAPLWRPCRRLYWLKTQAQKECRESFAATPQSSRVKNASASLGRRCLAMNSACSRLSPCGRMRTQ
jgi:hypothetical protein